MTRTQPSAPILSLLRFIESENEALAGDLVEEWRAGRSRRWFWGQLLRAVVVVSWQRRWSSQDRPVLGLVATTPFERPDFSLKLIDPATINLSGIKVRGIGGLGLLAIIMLITIVIPQAWFLVITGIAGGAVLGVVAIVRRRARGLAGPDDSAPLSLFGSIADSPVAKTPFETGHRSVRARLVVVTR